MQASSALIHEFEKHKQIILDDEGDQMVGFYYQFIDANSLPVSGLIGPYKYKGEAEGAAQRAFARNDI